MTLRQADAQAWGRILALLEQLKNDSELIDKLLDHDFEENHGIKFNVSKYQEFWQAGYDIWRLRALDGGSAALPYRIIYAYDVKGPGFCVLAIVNRSFNYDSSHAITKRIRSTYENLGLPVYRAR